MSSSSTFIQRWTSVNDLTTKTTNSNNNKQSNPFFLRPQPAPPPPPPPPSSSNLRPSQSLISLVESISIPSKFRCQPSKNSFLSSSRVANIIHQFESQSTSLMNNSSKLSSPIRSVFVKQWETTRKNGTSPRTPPILVVETSSPIPFTSKKTNNKPQPIIICERITNHNRSTPPPVSPKPPLTKTWSQLKLISQQQQQMKALESDTDSAIHTMVTVIANDSTILSRSSTSATTDSTCSSSCSSSSNASSTPRFARPTIASTQKQRQIISNLNSFKRTNSPPSSIHTFTRAVPSMIVPLCSINEDLEQQSSTRFSSSDINSLSTQEIILAKNSITEILTINTNLPLRYKRDSLIRLYG